MMGTVVFIMTLAGLPFLFFGRQLFWLFTAFSGFLLGVVLGSLLARDMGQAGIAVIGLMTGGLFAVLSIYLQKPMAAVSAFLLGGAVLALLYVFFVAGGAVLYNLPGVFGGATPALFMLGGVLSAVLVWIIFEWALVIISSLFGALLVTPGLLLLLPLPGALSLPILLALAALGVFVQSRLLSRLTAPARRIPSPARPAPPTRPAPPGRRP